MRGLSFSLREGECFCLVGESGCGKTITALSILRLLPEPPFLPPQGAIGFRGRDLLRLEQEELRRIRGRRIAMVFQEPMTALNPVMTIGRQIEEMVEIHLPLSARERRRRVLEVLEAAGIPEPESRFHSYPHELSGGLRQRAMIAMAISCDPELIIADEPTTALDVTVQARILRLLHRLQGERNMALLMIAHNLGIVAQIGQRVGVMYAGKMVEVSGVEELFEGPLHPYTRGLLAALPYGAAVEKERLTAIPGQVPALHQLGRPGCPFAERCGQVMERCRHEEPPLRPVGGRLCACHLYM